MLVEVTHILGLVQVTQSCPTLCDPMDCSTPGFPVHHQIRELAQTHVHQVSDAIQLSHPLSSPSPSAFSLSQHQGLFLCLPPVFPTPVTSPSAPCSPVPGPSPGRLPLVDLSSPVTQSKTRISKNPYPGLSHRRHIYQRSTRTGPWHRRTRSRRGGGRSQDTKHRDHPQMDGCLLLVIFPKITDIQGWCVCPVSQHRPLCYSPQQGRGLYWDV